MKKSFLITFLLLEFCSLFVAAKFRNSFTKLDSDSVKVRIFNVRGNIYMLDCVNGFAGGNVAASIGKDGILIVDDMYASMGKQLKDTLAKRSSKPIKIVINTHFHGDHIQGNVNFSATSVIVGHENLPKHIVGNAKSASDVSTMLPAVTFADSLNIIFNDEKVQLIHYPNAHTDGDAVIYFTKSRVLHLGDLFFFGMFPAVYANGGGNIKGLITALDQILSRFPPDTQVIPGHGNLASMKDLSSYVSMLKHTVSIVEQGIKSGVSLEEMQKQKVLSQYDELGSGGAQTTEQYLTMLYGLIK